ncbi:MAG TPA: alpha-ketoglutarate permease, partial [Variovorax sp.]
MTSAAGSLDGAAASTPLPYTSAEKRHRIFAIMAASSGNLVEWFDFYVY